MSTVYDEDIAAALEMIQEFGQLCTWQKQVSTPTDPAHPWFGGEAPPQDFNPYIVFLPATDSASSGFGLTKFRKGEDVPAFSTFGLMGAQDFTPEVADKLFRAGLALTVVGVDTIAPADKPVLHILSIV